MAKLNVNIGLSVNDKTGDTLRTAFDKINQNFTELYTLTGGTSTALTELAQDYAAPLFNHASHTNITVTYDDANNKILLTGVAAQVQSDWTASSGLGVILNKPTLFSGSYTDLTSKPTIPAAAAWPVTNTSGASGPTKVAIGQKAGDVTQGYSALAIGANAGETSQGNSAVAIGEYTGTTNQGDYAVAVGRSAGYTAQGANAVAIGRLAGYSSQPANTIILNATAVAVNGVAAQTDSFYVSPIRTATATSNVLYYNTTTKEITYAAAGSVSSLVNGAHTLSLGSDSAVTLPNYNTGVGSKIKSAVDIKIQAGAYYLSNLSPLYAEPFTIVFSISSAPNWATVVAVGDYVISGTCVMQITVVAAPDAGEWRITLSTTDFTGASDVNGNSSWSFYKPGATNSIWTFGLNGKLTAPGNLQVDGGKIILNSAGNAYVESVDYGVNSANSAVNIFGGPYQKIKLRAGFGTQATWTLGTDGSLTFPNATVQTTAWTGASSITWPVTNTAGASGPTKVAIGRYAGEVTQGAHAVAIGDSAGYTGQVAGAVAIGWQTGETTQGDSAVAIGNSAGRTSQGAGAVAIGLYAGYTDQAANSIIINATGAQLNQTVASTFTVAPIRNATGTHGVLQYNTATKEVTYSGSITFLDATVQTTAYIAPTTGNSVIDSINPLTISRNGMTIRVTSAGMIQMSFNSVIGITGRSSINNADSAVIASPNGATVISTWYNIGAVLALGDHLTATIVDASFHRIYRLTVTMREKGTTPGSEFATAYAIIEQIQ